MGSKKKAELSLMASIDSDEEWQELTKGKEGVLTVVDVYSEWAGPCLAMANYLKKIKLEVGDDLLQCAMANSDAIEALTMFRGHCKPIWLFLVSGQPVEVMHGSNAPLLGRIIQTQMERLKAGEPVTQIIALEDAVPESELHLDLALERQEKLCRELSKKMENKKLFDETEFALLYLQEYVHSNEEMYKTVTQLVTDSGLHLMSVCEAKLEEEEPRTLLKDTGFEDQCAKLNNHPAKKCLVIFALTPETSEIINEKMTEVELELLENEEMTLDEDKIQVLLDDQQESEEAIVEEMKIQLTGKPVQVFAYRNMKGNIDEAMFENLEDLEVKPILTTKTDTVVWTIFPDFGNKKPEEVVPVEE